MGAGDGPNPGRLAGGADSAAPRHLEQRTPAHAMQLGSSATRRNGNGDIAALGGTTHFRRPASDNAYSVAFVIAREVLDMTRLSLNV